jgi:hypothetical protein
MYRTSAVIKGAFGYPAVVAPERRRRALAVVEEIPAPAATAVSDGKRQQGAGVSHSHADRARQGLAQGVAELGGSVSRRRYKDTRVHFFFGKRGGAITASNRVEFLETNTPLPPARCMEYCRVWTCKAGCGHIYLDAAPPPFF